MVGGVELHCSKQAKPIVVGHDDGAATSPVHSQTSSCFSALPWSAVVDTTSNLPAGRGGLHPEQCFISAVVQNDIQK